MEGIKAIDLRPKNIPPDVVLLLIRKVPKIQLLQRRIRVFDDGRDAFTSPGATAKLFRVEAIVIQVQLALLFPIVELLGGIF